MVRGGGHLGLDPTLDNEAVMTNLAFDTADHETADRVSYVSTHRFPMS
jgi:hypothetical protein